MSESQVIHPFIVGRGRAGQAISESISILMRQMPEITWREPTWVERSSPLRPAQDGLSIAFISNPNGLHAARILEAEQAGFNAIASEKPACVTPEQAKKLATLKTPSAVFHVYRQMWGPQTLKRMIEAGEFGEIITIEGRYWQSSTAERALSNRPTPSWKNDLSISGPSDALLDVGTHWADAAVFLMGQFPQRTSGWASYINAEAQHRDTHVHLTMEFEGGKRALTSISKTMHGATNHFELNVIGSKGSGTWTFLNPDEILVGSGRDRSVMTRKTNDLGSQHPPFHATGWLEGYIEIIRQLVLDITSRRTTSYPNIPENARLISALLEAGIIRNG